MEFSINLIEFVSLLPNRERIRCWNRIVARMNGGGEDLERDERIDERGRNNRRGIEPGWMARGQASEGN